MLGKKQEVIIIKQNKIFFMIYKIYKMTDKKKWWEWEDNSILRANAGHLIEKLKKKTKIKEEEIKKKEELGLPVSIEERITGSTDLEVLTGILKYYDMRNNIWFLLIVIMVMLLIVFGQIPSNNYNLAVFCGFMVILLSLDYIVIHLDQYIKNCIRFYNEKTTIKKDEYYLKYHYHKLRPYSTVLLTISRWLKL
jgi:hypothetical protein